MTRRADCTPLCMPAALVVTVAFAACLAQSSPAAAETGGAKALAEAAVALAGPAPGAAAGNGRLAFRIVLLLDRIAAEHPRSLEAQLLRRQNRLPGAALDAAALRAAAAAWAAAYPAEAAALRADPDAGEPGGARTAAGEGAGVLRLPPPARAGGSDPLLPRVVGQPAPAPRAAPPSVAQGDGAARTGTKAAARQALRRAAVMVYFVGQAARDARGIVPVHVGSGAFIGPDLVLTNAHVVDAMTNNVGHWLVINETWGIWPATVVAHARRDTPVKVDAAVLRVQGMRATDWLGFNEAPQLDEWIAIAGYPGDATLLDARHRLLEEALAAGRVPARADLPTALLNEGRINNVVKNVTSGASDLQYTMITAPGNSGSPVVNACGEVVALHYSGGARAASVKFNGGVHARDVASFLRLAGIPFASGTAPCTTPE